MTLQTIKVSNAVSLRAIQTDRFKTGVLTFTLLVPLSVRSTALHILLAGIMRRGTKSYPSVSLINRRLDDLYATDVEIRSAKLGKNLLLTITAEMLDPRYVPAEDDLLGGVIETVAELLFRPIVKDGGFDKKSVHQEIRCALDALDAEINNTRAYAVTKCTEWMNRNDPEYPTVAALRKHLEEADEHVLYEHYCSLLSSSAIDVFYVGSLPPEKVAMKLARTLSESDISVPLAPLPLSAATPCAPVDKVEKMPVSQGKLAMGFRTGICASSDSNDHVLALLLNELFGGSPASKLFLNVREKMSLCYYCSSSYSIYTGDMMVSSGIEVKNRAVAEAAIRQQLEEIRQGNVSDAEFHAAKQSLCNCYRQLYDNPLDLQAFYSARLLFGIQETIEEACERMEATRLEDVIALARRTVCDTVFFVEGTRVSQDEGEEEFDEE